ncbi:hypothetical protein Athai_65200 [Actinocatenispora thailandica]|uniref:YbjN domain-containing protein n=1 Tax=Actinocatenispora thailandica TaxID=227318 RepID=A0A7R7DX52_9ACTN|nr:YbjN domain-containing protein [Actinocatenispora thailandica]BCJ39017.1 hypothetical protein Athai_65200 [Actinocatenispora thailandica]
MSERPEPARADRAPLTQRTLIGDSATVDLRGKVDGAWSDFRTAMEAALPAMPVGSRLTVTLDPTATGTGEAVYDVVLRVLPQSVVHADAVGNAGLPEDYRLDRVAVGDLVALGWSPPGVVEETADRFGLRVPMDEAPGVASVVTRTLRDVYGAPHPAFLTYTVSGDDVLPALGSARPVAAGTVLAAHPPSSAVAAIDIPLEEQVRTVVASLMKTDPDALNPDDDGEFSVRAGSAMVFVRINDNPRLVDVYSPILTEVEPDERLYERLSQLTQRMPIGRLYCTEGTVWASVPVFGRDFQPTHLLLALQVMTRLADELDDRLQGDFGGKRFFGEGDKGVSRAERTGMYL